MACWPAQPPPHPPSHNSSEIKFHHTKSHHQLVLQETAESNWACFSSWRRWVFSSPRHSQAWAKKLLLWGVNETKLHCFCSTIDLASHIICFENLSLRIDFVLVRYWCFKSNKNETNTRWDLYFMSVWILTVFNLKNSAFLLQIAQMFDHH